MRKEGREMFYKIAKTLGVIASVTGIIMMVGACFGKKSGAVLFICSTWIYDVFCRSICAGIFPDAGKPGTEKENKGGEGACQKRSSVRGGSR